MVISSQQVSIFLSYAHEDEPWRKKLEKHLSVLQRQELISMWSDRQIVPGTSWANVIDQRLEQASIILLLVSSDFLASNYCYGIEMKRALERHEAGQARVIPIAVRPTDWEGAPFAQLQALPTNAKAISTWKNKDEALVNVATGLRRAIEDLSFSPASSTCTALSPLWTIPYPHNPFFLGRDEVLETLHTQLQIGQATARSQSPYAISGLGGIGKTQIATEYAYRYHQDYQAVLWARADTLETLISSYTTIAMLLNLPERDAEGQEIIIEAVKKWLQTHRKWLLLLDNADDLDLLPPFLPPVAGGHILLTARAWDMQRLATRLEVETLSDEQGAVLLLRRSGLLPPDSEVSQIPSEDHRIATLLTHELGGLPLALDQAGAYLEATGIRVQEYYKLYQAHRRALLTERRSLLPDHPEPVATAWSLSFEKVKKRSPLATDLLQLCTWLHPDAIPMELVAQAAASSASNDALALDEAIATLRTYSLIRWDANGKMFSLHRLVQAVLRDSIERQARRSGAERAVQAVNQVFPIVSFRSLSQCEQYLPHAFVCTELIEQEQLTGREAARLCYKTGCYLLARARPFDAYSLLEQALLIEEQQLHLEQTDRASMIDRLADCLRLQGKYIEAEPLYKRALSIRETHLGANHPETARSWNQVALLDTMLGKYERAELFYGQALRIREQALGPEHPDTAQSLNDLASLYWKQGKYQRAKPLFQRALTIREQTLGPEHPDTGQSVWWLASLSKKHMQEYEKAKSLYQRALTIYEHTRGEEHPQTQKVRRGYLSLLKIMGREHEA